MYWYWWAWFAFVALLILVPVSYGWGYRQWGPPYPRYYYRRRPPGRRLDPTGMADAAPQQWVGSEEDRPLMAERQVGTDQNKTWGVIGDLIWLAAFGALIWAIVAAAY